MARRASSGKRTPPRSSRSRGSSPRKRRRLSPVGCLAWFAALLLIVVLFLAMRPTLAKVIHSSGLAGIFGAGAAAEERAAEDGSSSPAPVVQETPPEPERTQPSPAAAAPTTASPAATSSPPPVSAPAPTTAPAQESRSSTPPPAAPRESAARGQQSGTGASGAAAGAARSASPGPTQAAHTRRSRLYFVKIADDGRATLSSLTRNVAYADSPLADTLKALIAGPLPEEKAKGYRSLIPEGTRVENVYVQGSTAFVSFNEPFRYNSFGHDGLEAQLRQVVYTVTEFSNVASVQILIGGKVTDYLGPEGIRIRDPLSRESLGGEAR